VKHYLSIPKENPCPGLSMYGFDKLDGNNFRSEWSRKRKFYKFGSRNQLIGEDCLLLKQAPAILVTKFEKELSDIFIKARYEHVTCFFEFHGKNSFAGIHDPAEIQTLSLIDVNPYKQGILPPKEYLHLVGHLDIAKLLYHGVPTYEFVQQVKNGTLPGMTFEGVVCKARNNKKTPIPLMFKIKSDAWIKKLTEYCNGDETLFKKLS
jgi:hypothetical protein